MNPRDSSTQTSTRKLLSWAILPLIYGIIVFFFPRPATVAPAGWRLFGIFAATIAGLILQPIPGGALVLVAVILAALLGGLTVSHALAGFGDPVVWLVMAAFFISTALIKTGLARRIALLFVRTIGQSSLGVCYALAFTDLVLASIIPSNGARSGGVVLPIVRSVAELYDSRPGETAGRIGTFLMTGVYQSICVTAAMFLTGQASNPLAAQIASTTFHFPITWVSWFIAGLAPGLVSLAIIPWLVFRISPPEIRRTPEAATFAREELIRMGPMDRDQYIVLAIFALVCGLWIFSPLDITLSALLGAGALLLTRVLTWGDVTGDRTAWDIFIWYGGLVQLGKSLNETGVTRAFAGAVSGAFPATGWVTLFVVALALYFYSHYGFASITTHILSMFAAFAAVLIAKGAPVGLVVFSLACFTNLSAGLTNYGTTPAPMFYIQGYVTFEKWWKIGFLISLVNIAVWSTVGFAWWKLLKIW